MSKLLDKRDNGVSQLISSKNEWAKELWVKAMANHWTPMQVNMSEDIKQWKDENFFSKDERLLVKRALGLFAAGESLVSNSIQTGEWPYLTDGACRQYMIRKNAEEAVHNWTVKVCCESYNLSVEEVAEAYLNIPSIKAKERFLMQSLSNFGDKNFDIETVEGKQKFLKNMVIFYLVCEGTWFFSNFALLLAMGRQNKLPGLMDQITYSLKDESLHVEFGCKVLSQTQREYPEVWTKEFKEEVREIMRSGTEVEFAYARDVLPTGILGITPPMLDQYIKFLSNMRLKSIDLKPVYEECQNPFTWLGEAQDVSRMSAFFERHEKSYQNASALTDDL